VAKATPLPLVIDCHRRGSNKKKKKLILSFRVVKPPSRATIWLDGGFSNPDRPILGGSMASHPQEPNQTFIFILLLGVAEAAPMALRDGSATPKVLKIMAKEIWGVSITDKSTTKTYRLETR
jgi:hypothetical protein